MSILKIVGIVLLVAGAVILVLGLYNLISFSTSGGGKALNRIAGAFGGQTEVVRNSIIQIIIGAAVGAVGFFIYRKR